MNSNCIKTLRSKSSAIFCAAVMVLTSDTGTAADNLAAVTPAAGVFLVAAPRMRDPRFKQSVVLLVEHSEDGSLGLIVNKKTGLTIEQAFPEFNPNSANHELFFGGPVQVSHLGYVFSDSDQGAGQEVIDGVYWGTSIDQLRNLLQERDIASLRIFVGYAGWGPGQLQFELSLDDWQVLPASAEHVFTDSPWHLWRLLNRKKTGIIVRHGQSALRPSL